VGVTKVNGGGYAGDAVEQWWWLSMSRYHDLDVGSTITSAEKYLPT
jgi:hypothetical protein